MKELFIDKYTSELLIDEYLEALYNGKMNFFEFNKFSNN